MRLFLMLWALAASLLITPGSDRADSAQPMETVQEWTFNTDGDKGSWTEASGLTDVVVRGGVLRGTLSGRDPFISTSALHLVAHPWNMFQARLRIVQDEPLSQRGGELFYANSDAGPFGGFSQAKAVPWTAAESCREFGSGMYEAIRDNLCEQPASGWPLNYGPKDVGLGPYEYTEGAKY